MTSVVQEPALPETTIEVLDHGFLALDGALASDLAVVNGARVSFNQESGELSERDAGLIRFLIRERHGSPFEHGYFRFLVKAPLFVVREHHRHRAGHSYNEWSGRYSKMEAEFYVPDNVRTQVGKPGAYSFEPVDDEIREATRHEIEENAARAFETYERLLEQGVAKEVARTVLPLSTYTKYYWSCNPRSLMHFCGLRNHESAQFEIRQYAAAAESFLERLMPITHAAFVANDRAAP
ncbi:MAG: FAD-dependent thymidylate synthase [Gaiellaceae bacterium MAG52_C11]|nr:FAD-dependent thymidylate synthase [Candidatus Gaiellasilicea maunaloa]